MWWAARAHKLVAVVWLVVVGSRRVCIVGNVMYRVCERGLFVACWRLVLVVVCFVAVRLDSVSIDGFSREV